MVHRSDRETFTWRSPARWIVVTLLAAAAGGLLLAAGADASPTGPADGRVLALLSADGRGLYLVDLDKATLAVYQFDVESRRLRLLAARKFAWDLMLDEYNNDGPLPREVRDLVDQQRRLREQSPAEQ